MPKKIKKSGTVSMIKLSKGVFIIMDTKTAKNREDEILNVFKPLIPGLEKILGK